MTVKYFLFFITVIIFLGCNKNSNPIASPTPTGSSWQAIDVSKIVFDDMVGWTEEQAGVYKSYNNGKYAYINDTTISLLSFNVSFNAAWYSTGDQTGIILRTSPTSSTDGYYFTLYHYQSRYKFFTVINNSESLIEDGTAGGFIDSGYVSISFKVKEVTINNSKINEFTLFRNDTLISVLRDSTFKTWTLGFGRYNWYLWNNGNAKFKNISSWK